MNICGVITSTVRNAFDGAPAVPLVLLLRQLAGVVESLSERQYTMRPVGVVQSSIGAHVRHCLDHVQALVRALETGELDYDQRQRGTAVEHSRWAAIEAMRDLERQLAALTTDDLDRPLLVSTILASGGPVLHVSSSVGRELAFVVSHTIHHNALVGAMVKLLGGDLPQRFGYAPATVAHLEREERRRCARSA